MLQKSFIFLAAALLFCCAVGPARSQVSQWQLVAPMGTGCNAVGAATGPDGRIYAIGGSWSASAEVYDTRANRWSNIAPLPINSSTGAVYSAGFGNDGLIYALVTGAYGDGFRPYLLAYDIAPIPGRRESTCR